MDDLLNLTIVGGMVLISYLTALVLSRYTYFNFLFKRKKRYGAIDGLRGYLALSVFIHHFIITWYWHNTGTWARPSEDYFQNFGKIGVMIFFMITGFLFISKLIVDNGKTDWYKLYKSRIYPLWLCVLLIVSIIVFYRSNFHLNVELFSFLKQSIGWLIFYGYRINDYPHTNLIIAGVEWTLKYEWLFYLSLPFVAWIINGRKFILLFSISVILVLSDLRLNFYGIDTMHFRFFIIGGLVAYVNSTKLNINYIVQNKYFSILTLIAFFFALFSPHTYGLIQVTSVSIFFVSIALGNTMFGFFESKASILLGEISYSIYLLHGLILYILFSIINIFDLTKMSLIEYEFTMPIIAILIILISTLTYLVIELPGIKYGKR